MKDFKNNLVLLLFLWANIIFFLIINNNLPQYSMTMVPFIYLAGAVFLVKIFNRKLLFFMLALIAAAGGNFVNLYKQHNAYTSADSRLLAREWVLKNIKKGEPVIYQKFGPPMSDYDPAVNGSASLVPSDYNISYSSTPLNRNKVLGYKYFITSRYRNFSADNNTAGCGELVKEFIPESQYEPDIKVYRNVLCEKYNYKTVKKIDFLKKDSWEILSSDRDIEPEIRNTGKSLLFSFKDVRRKEMYHYFVQNSDLNVMFREKIIAGNNIYFRIKFRWEKEVRLNMAFTTAGGKKVQAVEMKRGTERTVESVFPVPGGGVESIRFSLSRPHHSKETNRRFFMEIQSMEIVELLTP